jgi:ribulose-5-phosphate 4-epimerase/fuculose-1-phosphate aldolase
MASREDEMAGGAQLRSLKGQVSDAEWRARVDLAALYRLVALHGWDDLIFTHISARLPTEEPQFLINPYGMFFGEITASDLVRVDMEANILEDRQVFINPAGFTIHSAVHAARPDAHFVIHTHSRNGVAVSAQKDGLLPISQHALICRPHLAYHDYEGIALRLDERERIVRNLGACAMMLLRNHGVLTLGATAGQAWVAAFFLEQACDIQVRALSAGRENVLFATDAAANEVRGQTDMALGGGGRLIWPATLRDLNRRSPGYDA